MKLRIFGSLAIPVAGWIVPRCLLLALAGFALSAWSAAAETVTTYTYTGDPFSVADCRAYLVELYSPCADDGNVTASITYFNVPPGWAGAVLQSQIPSFNSQQNRWNFDLTLFSIINYIWPQQQLECPLLAITLTRHFQMSVFRTALLYLGS
jgi:hypothetical protein